MKNLMNKVLVVLTMSALCVGNVDAMRKSAKKSAPMTAGERSAVKNMSSDEQALNRIMVKGAANPAVEGGYTFAQRAADIKLLEESTKGAVKGDIAVLRNALNEKDRNKRMQAFSENGNAVKAGATIAVFLAGAGLKQANTNFEDNKTAANAKKLEEAKNNAVAAVGSLDETAASNWKSYLTQRNLIMAAIGVATVATAAYVGYYDIGGATTAARALGTTVYTKGGEAAEYLGLGETGYLGSKARRLKNWAADTAVSKAIAGGMAAVSARVWGAGTKEDPKQLGPKTPVIQQGTPEVIPAENADQSKPVIQVDAEVGTPASEVKTEDLTNPV
jgi:hypothetical protein